MIVTIEKNDKDNLRVDLFVLEKLKELGFEVPSRTFLHRIFKDVVKVNNHESKSSYKLRPGDRVEVLEGKIQQELQQKDNNIGIVPQSGDLNILHESKQYLVLKKPKGIAVHPGVKNSENTLVNFVRGYLEGKGEFDARLNRAGLVHRLDKCVSGIIIFAKTPKAQEYLQKEFENHEVKKIYRARTVGESGLPVSKRNIKEELEMLLKSNFKMDESWFLLEGYIGRDRKNRLRMEFKKEKFPNSKKAISYIKRIAENEYLVNILTGRMHQIRATLAYMGIPIEGDFLYEKTGKYEIPECIELESVLISFKDMNGKEVIYRLY